MLCISVFIYQRIKLDVYAKFSLCILKLLNLIVVFYFRMWEKESLWKMMRWTRVT